MNQPLKKEVVAEFAAYLRKEEKAPATVDKYIRDMKEFVQWLGERAVSKDAAAAWKEELLHTGLAPVTIQSKLSVLNRFLVFLKMEECRVRNLRIQRSAFRGPEKELTKGEYMRLLAVAEGTGKHRLALLMETICATGIRVSEVEYITVEAARRGRTDISLKSKIRTILLPGKLCRKLLEYAKKQKIKTGPLFRTKSGRGLTRRQIWAEMKSLCSKADVEPTKVFPHNLRHLFARTFYHVYHDIAKLADILGHSSIETTRIYLISTGAEHRRHLERLGLVL